MVVIEPGVIDKAVENVEGPCEVILASDGMPYDWLYPIFAFCVLNQRMISNTIKGVLLATHETRPGLEEPPDVSKLP